MYDFSPAFIQGHPNGILYLAKTLTDSNYKFNLKAIFTTGETLLSDDKQIIEEAFNTKAYQQYGSGENCFSSAQEAPNEKGYLINFEHGYIELVKNGDFHEVVVTSLQNNVMPFVRYKIGDFVKAFLNLDTLSKYNLPIMFDEVIGRTDDILTDTEGNVILPVKIRMNLKPFLFSGTNYQLIQTNNTNFKLNLIDTEKKINTKCKTKIKINFR